jgi:hypothetical protein
MGQLVVAMGVWLAPIPMRMRDASTRFLGPFLVRSIFFHGSGLTWGKILLCPFNYFFLLHVGLFVFAAHLSPYHYVISLSHVVLLIAAFMSLELMAC